MNLDRLASLTDSLRLLIGPPEPRSTFLGLSELQWDFLRVRAFRRWRDFALADDPRHHEARIDIAIMERCERLAARGWDQLPITQRAEEAAAR